MPILRFDVFRQPVSSAAGGETGSVTEATSAATFTFSTAGGSASGYEAEDGFVVLAGSTARRTPSGTFPAGYLALRDQLVADGKLIDGPTPDLYTFATDVPFTSPSAAASIVAARSASGPREWRLEDSGKMYKDWKADRLEEPAES